MVNSHGECRGSFAVCLRTAPHATILRSSYIFSTMMKNLIALAATFAVRILRFALHTASGHRAVGGARNKSVHPCSHNVASSRT